MPAGWRSDPFQSSVGAPVGQICDDEVRGHESLDRVLGDFDGIIGCGGGHDRLLREGGHASLHFYFAGLDKSPSRLMPSYL